MIEYPKYIRFHIQGSPTHDYYGEIVKYDSFGKFGGRIKVKMANPYSFHSKFVYLDWPRNHSFTKEISKKEYLTALVMNS